MIFSEHTKYGSIKDNLPAYEKAKNTMDPNDFKEWKYTSAGYLPNLANAMRKGKDEAAEVFISIIRSIRRTNNSCWEAWIEYYMLFESYYSAPTLIERAPTLWEAALAELKIEDNDSLSFSDFCYDLIIKKRIKMLDFNELGEIVQDILTKVPEVRENSKRLIARVWTVELGGMENLRKLSAVDLIQKFISKEISSPLRIYEVQYAIQQIDPNTRGPNFKMKEEPSEATLEEVKDFQKIVLDRMK